MGRLIRKTLPGVCYHLLNRRVMRLPLFDDQGDYLAFERVLHQSLERKDAPRLLAWCLMPNHWHLVVQARVGTSLSTWMQWVTVTHTHRWHQHRHTSGQGPVYQGRFKSLPVQDDLHFLTLCRYVESNALRAGLCDRAEAWRWGSLGASLNARSEEQANLHPAAWPVERPRHWVNEVNRSLDEETLKTIRESMARGRPIGDDAWKSRVLTQADLESTIRPRGRPRKEANNST
jgi:putative transposase